MYKSRDSFFKIDLLMTLGRKIYFLGMENGRTRARSVFSFSLVFQRTPIAVLVLLIYFNQRFCGKSNTVITARREIPNVFCKCHF
jgi:hypothetical protein